MFGCCVVSFFGFLFLLITMSLGVWIYSFIFEGIYEEKISDYYTILISVDTIVIFNSRRIVAFLIFAFRRYFPGYERIFRILLYCILVPLMLYFVISCIVINVLTNEEILKHGWYVTLSFLLGMYSEFDLSYWGGRCVLHAILQIDDAEKRRVIVRICWYLLLISSVLVISFVVIFSFIISKFDNYLNLALIFSLPVLLTNLLYFSIVLYFISEPDVRLEYDKLCRACTVYSIWLLIFLGMMHTVLCVFGILMWWMIEVIDITKKFLGDKFSKPIPSVEIFFILTGAGVLLNSIAVNFQIIQFNVNAHRVDPIEDHRDAVDNSEDDSSSSVQEEEEHIIDFVSLLWDVVNIFGTSIWMFFCEGCYFRFTSKVDKEVYVLGKSYPILHDFTEEKAKDVLSYLVTKCILFFSVGIIVSAGLTFTLLYIQDVL